MQIGEQILKLRKKRGLTQSAFAEKLYVTPQAVSQWERGVTVPDTDKLADIASALNTTVSMLTGESVSEEDWTVAATFFSPERMYSRMTVTAELEGLRETFSALRFMEQEHEGQFRKPSFFSESKVPYIAHPLMMACHAHALGIREDKILAAILLHDVCEDCGVDPDSLPVSDDVKKAVEVLTYQDDPIIEDSILKKQYYQAISGDRIATIVKILDRCNNISTMASSFSEKKLVSYIDETETYVMPLLEQAKHSIPEYVDALYVIKYHMKSVLESLKAIMLRQIV